jgi:hypothetical protein
MAKSKNERTGELRRLLGEEDGDVEVLDEEEDITATYIRTAHNRAVESCSSTSPTLPVTHQLAHGDLSAFKFP